MGLCKDCKHWGKTEHAWAESEASTAKGCGSPKFRYGYGISDEEQKQDEIVIEFDEGWGCYTGPAFGCVHFELAEELWIETNNDRKKETSEMPYIEMDTIIHKIRGEIKRYEESIEERVKQKDWEAACEFDHKKDAVEEILRLIQRDRTLGGLG